MSNTSVNFAPRTATHPATRPASVRQLALHVLDRLLEWQDRAASRQSIGELDDRLLKDIGLDRAKLQGEARKPFWQA